MQKTLGSSVEEIFGNGFVFRGNDLPQAKYPLFKNASFETGLTLLLFK